MYIRKEESFEEIFRLKLLNFRKNIFEYIHKEIDTLDTKINDLKKVVNKLEDNQPQNLVNSISSQLREGEEWAIIRFLSENPDHSFKDIELVYLSGNPFAYYVKSLKKDA